MSEAQTTTMMKAFEFRGEAIVFRQKLDGEWFTTAEDVAKRLNYGSKNQVIRIFNRHHGEFKTGEATEVRLTSVDGKSRLVKAFSPRGVMRIALHADTDVAEEFRDFVLDVMDDLRSGQAGLVTKEQIAEILRHELAKRDEIWEGRLTALQARHDEQTRILLTISKVAEKAVSNAGATLAFARHHPETRDDAIRISLRRELRDRRNGQMFITPPPNNRLSGLDGTN